MFFLSFSRCRIWQFWTYASAFVSIYTLVLMSVDRFLAVVYPIESMTWRTEAKCVQAILFTWVLTGLCCVPLIASHGESFPVPGNPNVTYCIFSDNASVPLLPEAWDLRWNDTAFRVSAPRLFIRIFLKVQPLISSFALSLDFLIFQ